MSERKGKPAVSLQAAVKYLIKQRDEYKAKLDKLIPYTKSLEQQLKEAAEPYEHKIKSLEGDLKHLRKENATLHKGYKESDWYANMVRDIQRLRKENKELWEAIQRYHIAFKQDLQ